MKKLLLATIFLSLLAVNTFAQPVLKIYTYDSLAAEWGIGPKLKIGFEKECGCQVVFTALEDAVSILNRLRIEGDSAQADLVIGLDNHMLVTARDTGLFDTHGQALKEIDNLPVEWSDKVFLPFDFGWFDFVYKADRLPSPPKSLDDLIFNADQKITVIVQDPRVSSPGLGLVVWLRTLYVERTAEAWRSLSPKIRTVTKGWSDAYALFLKGEADMVLSYTTSPAYHLIAESDGGFRSLMPAEGNLMQTEVAAVLKSSTNKKLARNFMRFLISAEVQRQIPETQWMHPVRKVALPEGFESQGRPARSLTASETLSDKDRKAWINEWRSALSQR